MKSKIKVYVVGGDDVYSNWIPNHEITDDIKSADLVLFTGGEDVSPSLYGEKEGRRTCSNRARDRYEVLEFEEAKKLGKPMLGICRGSQFLCVMNGGRLVQHQENKYAIHPIETSDGQIIDITSTHHQAQFPYNLNEDKYTLLAWTDKLSRYHLDGEDNEMINEKFKEAEIVYYKDTNSLGIQGHPEYMWDNKDMHKQTFNYLHNLVNNLLNKSL